jgi:hypothetical protein
MNPSYACCVDQFCVLTCVEVVVLVSCVQVRVRLTRENAQGIHELRHGHVPCSRKKHGFQFGTIV